VICTKLFDRFGLTLNRSTLWQYEHGTVGAPDATILWGLGQLYHVPTDALLEVLMGDILGDRHAPRPNAIAPLDADQRLIAELAGDVTSAGRQAVIMVLRVLREASDGVEARPRSA
jgi:transcriptional regulator with XRE-family HTH domain